MRVLLLRSLGGHPARSVVEQDQAAAAWLLSTGLAVSAPDTGTATSGPTEPREIEQTGSADPEPMPSSEPIIRETARRGRRPSRAATPGG